MNPQRPFLVRTRRLLSAMLSLSIVLQPLAAVAADAPYRYQVPMDAPDMSAVTAGQLQASPGSANFGVLVLGSTAAATTTIRNTGQDSVAISGIDISGPFSQTNNCPSVLVGGASCSATVTFVPASAGVYSASLVVSGAAGAATFAVSGTAVDPTTNLTLAPNQLNFGAVDVGTSTSPQSVVLTNAGNSPATVNGVGVAGADFAQSNNCGGQLAPGGSCSVSVMFTPSAYGARSANLSIYEQASGTLYTVALSGSGNAAILGVAPASVDLGSAIVGYSSTTTQLTLSNNGNLPVTGLSATLNSADFSQVSTTCSGSIAANGSCSLTVKFAPTAAGAAATQLQVFSSNGGTRTVRLSGTGIAPNPSVQASGSALSFADTVVGSSSAAQSVTFTNNGNVDVQLTSAGIVAGGTHFQATSSCGTALAVGASCTANVTFSPAQAGSLTGVFTAAFSLASVTVDLSGKGTQGSASVSSNSLTFPATQVASSSATQLVTVTNTGNRTLSFSSAGIASGGADFSQSNNCASVAPGGTCVVNVVFTPSVAGARSGTLALLHDGVGATLVSLSGTGQTPSATLSAVAFGSVAVGSNSNATATLTNTGIASITVTQPTAASVTGTDFSFVSTTCGTSLAPSASCTVSLQFAPTSNVARSGSLSIGTGAGTKTATLDGTGIQGSVSLSASSLTFATQQVSSTSGAQSITVTNNGASSLTFSGVSVSAGAGDFAQTNNCATLAVNATCGINVTFTPGTTGARTGTVTLAHNGTGATSFALTGTGQGQGATLTTPSFAATPVGSNSNATATLSNTGIGALAVTTPSAASVAGGAFSFVATTCGTTLAVAGTCTVTVKFSPTSTAAASGSLSIGTGAGTQTVTLGSTGIQGFASMSPSSLTFAAQQVSSTSGTQAVTVTNTGTNTLTFTGVGISSGAADFAQSNNCGAVAVNGTCTVNVSFTPSTTGARSGTLAFTHDGGGIATVSLTGTGQAATATLSAVAFGSVAVSSNSTLTSTLQNTGIGTLSVTVPSAASVTGTDYSFASTTCGTSLAASATCTVSVKFAPTVAAVRSGTLSFATGAGAMTATLSGTGIEGNASLSPSSLTFAAQQVSTASGAQSVTVTNNGTSPLTISAVSVSAGAADYSQTNSCATTLAVNGTCSIDVTFTPTTTGARTGTVTLTHNGTGATSFALTGTGQGQGASLTTPSFAATPVGSNSNATATLSNTGIGALSVTTPSAASVTGTGFSFVSTTCGTSLTVSGTCTVTVKFAPTSTTAASGSLAIGTGAGTQTVTLGSAGIQGFASVSPSSLTFAAQQVSTTSGTQTVTVTNTGTNTLTFTGVGISSGAADFAQSNNCGAVAVNGTCTVNVSFTPSAAGARPGTLAFTHDGGGIATVSLTGTGQAPSATLSNVAFGNVAVAGNATLTSTLTNTGLAPISVTAPTAASVTGTDFSFVSTTCAASLGVGATCTVSLQFTPTANVARSGTLSFATGAGTQTATLGGTGIQGNASLSPASLTFAAQQVSTSSSAQSVTVTNNGTSPLTISAVSVSAGAADYSQTNGCVTTLAVNGTCAINVTFTPGTTGARSGTVTLTHNGTGATSFTLSGTGQSPSATLSNVAFGNLAVGGTTQLTSTLANTGVGSLSMTVPSAASVSGTDFSFVGTTCSASLAAASSCTVTLQFSPTANAVRAGSLSFATAAGAMTAPLSGTGIQGNASLSAASLSFPAQQLASTSSALTVTVTNNGTNTLTFSSLSVTSGATDFAQSNNCSTLAVNGTCTINVTFTPGTAGARSGTVTLVHNGSGATSVSLTGTGQAQSASLTTPSFAATPVGSGSSATATLSNTGIGALSVTVPSGSSVTGTDFSFSSTTCGSSLLVAGTCTVTVVFSPSSTVARTGNLSIVTGAGTKSVSLGSTGIQGYASISPGSLTFSAQQSGTTSAVQTLTVTNTGTNTLSFSGVGVSSGGTDFAQSNNCGAVAVNGTCTINVSFTPAAVGTRNGTVALTHNGGGIATVSLTGTGQAPSVSAAFQSGSAAMGVLGTGNDGGRWLTVSNNGVGPITLTSLSIPAPFSAWQGSPGNTATCYPGLAMAAGASCSTFVFKNAAIGVGDYATPQTLTVGYTSGSTGGSTTVGGFTVSVRNTSTGGLAFGSQADGTKRTANVTFTNSASDNPLRSVSVAFASNPSGYYTIESNGCSAGVPAGGSCTVTVGYAPGAWGSHSATLRLTGQYPRMIPGEDAQNGLTQTVDAAITGSRDGSQATLTSASSVALGSVAYGAASPTQYFTFRNDGNQSMSLNVTSLAWPFTYSNGCTGVAPGNSCSIAVGLYTSTTPTAYSSTLMFSGATLGNRSDLGVSGTITGAVATFVNSPSLSANYNASNTGKPTTSVTIRNDGNAAMTLTPSVDDARFQVIGNTCSGIAPGNTCTYTVTMDTNWYFAGGAYIYSTVYANGASYQTGTTATGLTYASEAQWQGATAIDFGTGTYLATTTRTAVVKNTGNLAWTPANFVYNGPGAGDEVLSNATSCGTIAPGASCTVTLSYYRKYHRPTWTQSNAYIGPVPFGNTLTLSGNTP